MRTHHSVYDAVLEEDEQKDQDRHIDLVKDKLTLTECVIALLFALTCVSLHAVFLVEEIPFIVEEKHVSDFFMGLILVPLVEKFAEHLTAIDEAWDNQMNFALIHVLGATIQTALLNAPLVVLVGWGIGKEMSLNFGRRGHFLSPNLSIADTRCWNRSLHDGGLLPRHTRGRKLPEVRFDISSFTLGPIIPHSPLYLLPLWMLNED